MVGKDDELSHEGGESEFFGFATIEETEVERSQDRVVAGGDERGHVKDRCDVNREVATWRDGPQKQPGSKGD